MELSQVLGLAAILLLVLANGFFVATEFAIVAVRRSRLQELVEQGPSQRRKSSRIWTRTSPPRSSASRSLHLPLAGSESPRWRACSNDRWKFSPNDSPSAQHTRLRLASHSFSSPGCILSLANSR